MRHSRIHTVCLFLFTIFFLVTGMACLWAAESLTYIDEYNRFILNGEAFFPLGLYVVQCPNGSYSSELDEIADSPFDTVMNYAVNNCGTDTTDAQILDYLDQLALRNLNLIFSLSEYFDGAPEATATWTFDVGLDGNYSVYAWWDAGLTRATDAPYTVNYSGGSETIRVNQKINGSQWNLLGTFPFVASTSGSIVLSNDANELVIADAVKIEGAGPSGGDIIMDEELATFTSTWNYVTGKPERYNGDHYWHARFFDDIVAISHKVNTFKTHPAIISWYLNDERDPSTYLTQLEERYQRIRELDQNHPVWSVHYRTDWLIQEAHTTDIVGVDPYPICNPYWNAPITLVSTQADEANVAGKPLWLVPQIFNWKDYELTGCPPTKAEMRAMSYLAVNHGAKGLVYYSYFNIVDDLDYATRWPQIKEIAGEIDTLRPVFLSIHQTNENDIVCNNSNIDFTLMRLNNTYYLPAVNTKEAAITGVSFQINQVYKSSVVDVLFEDRQATVIAGAFTDDFGPYEVHVYHWQGDVDKDGDGFDSTEEWGPHGADPNYDGNRDGHADSEQGNVASGHTYDDQHYVTLAVPDPATLSDCEAVDNDNSHAADAPTGVDFQYGFFEFTVKNVGVGDATTVTLYLPDGAAPATYYKYGPTPDDPTVHWYEFLYDGETGAEIDDNVITLHFMDGQGGDDDLDATNGIIIDQGGPGFTSTGGTDTTTTSGGGGGSSGGGCFIATAAFGSYMHPHVQVIRDFRNEYLLMNMPGRWFVGIYYTYGPFWADLLNAHPRYKPFVRLALMPVVGISYFLVKTSLATKLLTGFLLMGFVVICVLRIHGRSTTRGRYLRSVR